MLSSSTVIIPRRHRRSVRRRRDNSSYRPIPLLRILHPHRRFHPPFPATRPISAEISFHLIFACEQHYQEMSNNPPSLEGSPSEQSNSDTIERAIAVALGPSATQEMPNYRYLCSHCDRIVSTSIIIQSNLPDAGLNYDGAPEETFAHYENFRGLVQSAMRGCQLCDLLHKSSHGLPGFAYLWVIRKNAHHVEITLRGMTYEFGAAILPSVHRADNLALDRLIRSFRTDSDETFSCAATWLSTCLRNHEMCSINSADFNFRPRRLLKVSIVNSGLSIQLTHTHNITGKIQYLALSHCWGEAEGLELNEERLNTFCERIPLEILPKTFLDAVVITARLRCQYIWIASLCIIQDCPRDRNLEISAMGDIYKYSLCTIAALSARNSNEGCFVERDPLRYDRYQSLDDASFQRVQNLDALPGPDCTSQHRPRLHTRAWVVQERALSPRTLYYGSDMIYWECVQCRAFECRPKMEDFEKPGSGLLNIISGTKNSFKRLLTSCRSDPAVDWRHAWRILVQHYSTCQLTRDDDKWSAFQGLAMEVERHCGDRLLNGLWRNHLRRELLWFANGPGPGKALETQQLQPPSWSWVSINGRVMWLEDINAAFSHNHAEWTAIVSSSASSGASIKPARDSIIVEAPLVNLAEVFPRSRGAPGLNHQSERPNVSSVTWNPDTAQSVDISPKWALQFARTNGIRDNSKFITYFGLVVREVEGSPGIWKRLGFYQITWAQVDFRDSEPAWGLGATKSIMLV